MSSPQPKSLADGAIVRSKRQDILMHTGRLGSDTKGATVWVYDTITGSSATVICSKIIPENIVS